MGSIPVAGAKGYRKGIPTLYPFFQKEIYMTQNLTSKLPANSPLIRKPFGGLTSNMLRLLAMLFMLSDHLWASVMPGNQWMTDLGRLAFPIFAFMISEGYIHTSNPKKYLLRMTAFAVISEIPFDLFYNSTIFDPFNQNVLFTFVWGLLAIMQIDKIKKLFGTAREQQTKLPFGRLIGALLLIFLISIGAKFTFTDYKFYGYLTVVMFYVFRDFPFAFVCQLIAMLLFNWIWFKGLVTPIELFGRVTEIPHQAFAILALIPIWLYGGKRGRSLGKLGQYGFYAFYPAHMLILYAIWQFLSSH